MNKPDSRQYSFLPEPEFSPIWPTQNTLPARCLSMLLASHTFTHPEFEQLTGSWRLSAVVFTLIELGWPVESWDIAAPTPETPSRTISRYFLSPETIQKVFGEAK